MYRLFRRYKLPVRNVQFATVQVNLQHSHRICSICNFYHLQPINYNNHGIVRYQTTITEMACLDAAALKKVKHKIRKYAELLEVSAESTTDTKAIIKKLNATGVSNLANKPDISLDQLHKIKNINKLPNQKTSIAKTEQGPKETDASASEIFCPADELNSMAPSMSINLDEEDILPKNDELFEEDLMVLGPTDPTLIKNTSLLSRSHYDPEDDVNEDNLESVVHPDSQNSKKKAKTKLKVKYTDEEIEALNKEHLQTTKQNLLHENLHSYLSVCISSGMISQAFNTLQYYRSRAKRLKDQCSITDIAIYNCVLQGYASHGNLEKVKLLLQMIVEDSIQPNPQTYAAMFEVVSRKKDFQRHKEFLESVLSDMTSRGISLNDVLDKSVFTHDQREMTDRGIRVLVPDFEANYTRPDTSYSNHLLEKITGTIGQSIEPAKDIVTISELMTKARHQMQLEKTGSVTVKSVAVPPKLSSYALLCREKVAEIEKMWRTVITEAFQRELNVYQSQNTNGYHLKRTMNLYPYLTVLDTSVYVDVILDEVINRASGSETFSPGLHSLIGQLGRNIFHKYQMEMKHRNSVHSKIESIYNEYCKRYINGLNGTNARTTWLNLLHEKMHEGATADLEMVPWPYPVLVSIGRFLYNIILRDIKIDVNCIKANSQTQRYLPAFYAVFRNNDHRVTQEIKPHPFLWKLYRDAQLETLSFETSMLPLVGPPSPWYSPKNGGYLLTDTKVVRGVSDSTQQWQILKQLPQTQLYPIFDSLNQLSSIPWKINISVLNIAVKVFQDGGSQDLDIPEPPTTTPLPMIDVELSAEERKLAVKARLKEKRKRADTYSLWCDTLYRLSLANHYRDEVFWLPHNIDFRGRVYPIPPHVNHLGSDLARSLMVFAKGRPLGPDGFNWLKIHLVNLTGLRKRESNAERLRYANELLPQILDSAENPLGGEKFWQKSEEPWQTLAACFEIAEVSKSPNPAEYISRFPVHQDGSCNGLQHYAALGRDRQGAESVNLSSTEKPQDVYSFIVTLVEEQRRTHASEGLEIAQVLEGVIKRKVIKQTVMTTVYGVTRFGARLQIAKQLKEIDFPEEHLWAASHYLANQTFHSLREMFTSTKLIQDWLTESARVISSTCGKNIEWVTPLGLHVVQPYSRPTHTFNDRFAMPKKSNIEKPNVMKQKNAFPPNFIHSLDSTHMMLTGLHCEHEGITFVSVHDCFWTHASTVAAMNKICREQFVALHSEPILKNLSEFLVKTFGYVESDIVQDGSVTELSKKKVNRLLQQLPKHGDFDLNNVLRSEYFFS
ncbi:DNA-directed RNA polymerase, mitochondrial isoform X1 [Athalia rosae]|uniref:DNA-directed RNA polymerase, mitochondrial isoform X1 n=2 Tax=Athalia rosae TaxID=37344 RepID=UPI0020347E31|nr:DNA-directed RNA polymerase, mitochondrial isoform X1 [Athalia rosae]